MAAENGNGGTLAWVKKNLISLLAAGIFALAGYWGGYLVVAGNLASVDATNRVLASDKAALEANLQAFNEASGSQIVILIVPATAPESIEQFSIRLAESWKIGRKLVAQQSAVAFMPGKRPRFGQGDSDTACRRVHRFILSAEYKF